MLIWDTGASFGLTPFRSDFIDYVPCDIPVKDVTKVNRVVGIGTTLHKFYNTRGEEVFLPCVSYHLPDTDVRLFSPQTYHQMHGGESLVNGNHVVMMLRDHHIKIPINRNAANLPVVFKSFVSGKEKALIGPQMLSGLAHTRLSKLDFFGDLATTNDLWASDVECGLFEHDFEHYSNFCCPCVGSSSNENLSNAQRELLLWH